MKKLFIGLAFFGVLIFAIPTEAKAIQDECSTATLTCKCDGSKHIIMVCSEGDFDAWSALLCCPVTQ